MPEIIDKQIYTLSKKTDLIITQRDNFFVNNQAYFSTDEHAPQFYYQLQIYNARIIQGIYEIIPLLCSKLSQVNNPAEFLMYAGSFLLWKAHLNVANGIVLPNQDVLYFHLANYRATLSFTNDGFAIACQIMAEPELVNMYQRLVQANVVVVQDNRAAVTSITAPLSTASTPSMPPEISDSLTAKSTLDVPSLGYVHDNEMAEHAKDSDTEFGSAEGDDDQQLRSEILQSAPTLVPLPDAPVVLEAALQKKDPSPIATEPLAPKPAPEPPSLQQQFETLAKAHNFKETALRSLMEKNHFETEFYVQAVNCEYLKNRARVIVLEKIAGYSLEDYISAQNLSKTPFVQISAALGQKATALHKRIKEKDRAARVLKSEQELQSKQDQPSGEEQQTTHKQHKEGDERKNHKNLQAQESSGAQNNQQAALQQKRKQNEGKKKQDPHSQKNADKSQAEDKFLEELQDKRITNIKNAISEYDHASVERLMSENLTDTHFITQAFDLLDQKLKNEHANCSENFLRFVEGVTPGSDTCINVLTKLEGSVELDKILFRKLLAAPSRDFFTLSQTVSFEKIKSLLQASDIKKNGESEALDEFYAELDQAIVQAKDRSALWADAAMQRLVDELAPQNTVSVEHKYDLELFAKYQNRYKQTIIMLALKRSREVGHMNFSLLVYLLDSVRLSILHQDEDGLHAMNYWAKYYLPNHSLSILPKIWGLFIGSAVPTPGLQKKFKATSAVLLNTNFIADINDNTFLHHLIANIDSDYELCKALNALLELKSGGHIFTALFRVNNQGKSPAYLLDEKEQDFPLSTDFIHRSTIDLGFSLSDIFNAPEVAHPFFRIGAHYFGAYKNNIIAKYFTDGDFTRFLKIIERRCVLQANVHNRFVKEVAAAKNKTECEIKHEKLMLFFGEADLLNVEIDGRCLFDLITDVIVKDGDDSLEARIAKLGSFVQAKTLSPITYTLEWKKLLANLQSGNRTPFPAKYLAALMVLSNETDDYNKVALDYALDLTDERLVKFLCEHCKAEITDHVLASALRLDFNIAQQLSIVEWLFAKRASNGKEISHEQLSRNLIRLVTIVRPAPQKLSWLLANGFNPAFARGGSNENLLCSLINNIGETDIVTTIELIKVLLGSAEYKIGLFTEKDNRGHCVISYLAAAAISHEVTGDNLHTLFRLILENGACLNQTETSAGRSLLYLPLHLRDLELLRIFRKHTSQDQLNVMLDQVVEGKTIIQTTEQLVSQGKLPRDLLDELNDMKAASAPVPSLAKTLWPFS